MNAIPQRATSQETKASGFGARLLDWYDAHRRDLPWRRDRDPYRVWISEIMLQQTRVAAVIEHYHQFLRRFPTVQRLAAARAASVLAAWSGLGYYRRARMMHAAAQRIVRERGGRFPAKSRELEDLPGIGRYTAAAIASIAWDEPVAVVDGNVERVLQRKFDKRLAGKELWDAAQQLLDKKRPGDFNQAMMELGATVCTPRVPLCRMCPVLDFCSTRGELHPLRRTTPQQKHEVHHALALRNGRSDSKEILLVQRPHNASLMGGMWELPEANLQDGNDKPLFTVRHSVTVTDYTVRVWRETAPASSRGKWVAVPTLHRVALTGLARKILRKASLL